VSTASSATVRVTINGLPHEAAPGTRLLALLERLSVDTRRIAVERNGEVVPRTEAPALVLLDGDRYEVVAFVGGG
jgi:thiamine biosynthesis protein ThiS